MCNVDWNWSEMTLVMIYYEKQIKISGRGSADSGWAVNFRFGFHDGECHLSELISKIIINKKKSCIFSSVVLLID